MKYWLGICLALFLMSLSPEMDSPEGKLSIEIATQVAELGQNKYGLEPTIGTASVGGDKKIQNISYFFRRNKPASIEEARKMIVELTHDCRKMLKDTARYRENLSCSPDSSELFNLHIVFEEIKNSKEDQMVYMCRNSRGKLLYDRRLPNVPQEILVSMLEESFEKADEIVSKTK